MNNQSDDHKAEDKISKLMLNTEPFEDYNEVFLNQSLSEGYFSIDILKTRKSGNHNSSQSDSSEESSKDVANIKPPLLQLDLLSSFPQSPDPKTMLAQGQNVFPSQQKLEHQGSLSSSGQEQGKVAPVNGKERNMYANFLQYFLIKKFVKRISSKKNMNSKFNEYHFSVINDRASTLNLKLFKDNALQLKPMLQPTLDPKGPSLRYRIYSKSKQFVRQLINKLNSIAERIPLFYPEARFKLIWDGLMVCPRIYYMFVIPLDLSFGQEQFMFSTLFEATIVFLCMLLVDFLISFNTAYYKYGQIVVDRFQIAVHVLGKGFGMELASVMMLLGIWITSIYRQKYSVQVETQGYQLAMIIFIIQFRNITKYIRQVEEALNLSKPTSSILELLKLISAVIYVLHVFACLWFWAGDYSNRHWDKSWLTQRNLVGESWKRQYLYSFYYSTVTMFTVGYGDVTPQSDLEALISILFMMICSIQLSYSVSTVGAIIDKISAYEEEKMKKLQTINAWMQNKKISYPLQYQIREYLNYYWQAQNEEYSSQEKNIIGQLSENLRDRLIVEANSLILNNCVLFKNNFSAPLKRKLVKCIRQVVIQPENIIDFDSIVQGSSKNQIFICFIEKGQIEIFIENESGIIQGQTTNNGDVSIVSTVNEGASLGVMSFITGRKAPERFRTVGFTKLLLLSREDFLKIIPDFPEDYELFSYFQDQLKYSTACEFLRMDCFSCKSMNHRALDCPYLHFTPDKEFIIKQQQYSRDQKRNEIAGFVRERKKGMFHALMEIEEHKEAVECFQNDHWQEVQFYELDEDESSFIPLGIIEEIQNEEKQAKKRIYQIIVKIEILSRSKTRNFAIVEEPAVDELDLSDQDQSQSMKKSQQKKAKRSVQFTTQEEQQKKRSIFEDDKSKAELPPLVMHRSSAFALKAKRTNTVDIQSMKFGSGAKTGGLSRFRKAVAIVRQLNQMDRKKSMSKSERRSFLDTSIVEQERQARMQFERNQLQMLLQRSKRFKHACTPPLQRDSSTAEFMILKIQMMTESISPLNHFECMKTFKFYFPNNNLDALLHKYENYYSPNIQKVPDLQMLFSRLVRYLLYPYDYIEKYKFVQAPNIVRVNTVQLRTQATVDSQNRRRTLKKKSIQSSRKSQVRPMSDGVIMVNRLKKLTKPPHAHK